MAHYRLTKSGAWFIHILKTGGTWFRDVLKEAEIEFTGHEFTSLPPRSALSLLPTAVSVRNPYTWYGSFWAQRQYQGWGGDLIIGRYGPTDFCSFVRTCCARNPGFMSKLYSELVPDNATILRLESIREGAAKWLKSLYPSFGEGIAARVVIPNPISGMYREQLKYDAITAARLLLSEKAYFVKYGYPMWVPEYMKA